MGGWGDGGEGERGRGCCKPAASAYREGGRIRVTAHVGYDLEQRLRCVPAQTDRLSSARDMHGAAPDT